MIYKALKTAKRLFWPYFALKIEDNFGEMLSFKYYQR